MGTERQAEAVLRPLCFMKNVWAKGSERLIIEQDNAPGAGSGDFLGP